MIADAMGNVFGYRRIYRVADSTQAGCAIGDASTEAGRLPIMLYFSAPGYSPRRVQV